MTIASAPQSQQPQQQQPDSLGIQWVDAVHKLNDQFREYTAEVNARNISPEEKIREIAKFRDAAEPVLTAARQAFEKDIAAAQDDSYRRKLDSVTADADKEGAALIAGRTVDHLEHAESPVAAFQKLVDRASDDEIGSVVKNAESWLDARGHDTSFIPRVIARRLPEVADEASKRQRAHQLRDIGVTTVEQVRRGISQGSPVTHLMPIDTVRAYDV